MLNRPGYRATVLSLGALTAAAAVYAVGAWGAVTPQTPAGSCRASLVRVTLPGIGVIEPIVANDPNAPCASSDGDQGVGTIDLQPDFPLTARLLYAATNTSDPQAEAGVAKLDLPLSQLGDNGQLPDISARLLTSEAGVTCNGTTLVPHGSSHVVDLVIAGNEIEIPPPDDQGSNYLDIDLAPLPVRIQLNEQDTTPQGTETELTQRALHIELFAGTPAAIDVVVAESQVDWSGNPCSTTTTTGGTTTGGTTGTTSGGTTGTTSGGSTGGGGGPVVGWMNGGGQLANGVTHSLVLPCTTTQKHPKPQLQVQTPTGTFRLDALSSVSCTYDQNQGAPEQPDAGFNTLTGNGTGTCNGVSGVPVSFRFTDEGEPNKGADEAHITITNAACPVQADGTVNGNQQAHRGNNPPA
jgi:hypothetical protein